MKNLELVTTVIKAKNEEHQIAEAIQSAFLISDAVIVVDDGSSDSTADISIKCGARVVNGCIHNGQIDKLDHFGFSLVESGWILRMDADERVTEGLAHELRKLIGEPGYAGARFARLHVMFGAPVYGGGWFRPFQLAFFRADSWDKTWGAKLHSQVPVAGKIKTIKPSVGHSVHFDYGEIEEFVDRSLLKYAREEASQKFDAGIKFSPLDLLIKPWVKFFGRFILRRGFKDGKRGLVLAGLLAAYEICVACFHWQLDRKN
jgi:glycosyltransferase involved in cell wall biosynthesis